MGVALLVVGLQGITLTAAGAERVDLFKSTETLITRWKLHVGRSRRKHLIA